MSTTSTATSVTSSPPPSSSSLSSFVLHGDTLRCILAYFRRHAEINVLRRVNHTLEVESNKPSLWPPHLRVIQPREKNFLVQFTSDEKVKPSLCYVHQLDLRYVTSPRLKYLLHFTRLNTLRLNVRSIQHRAKYAHTLSIFLQKCGATIKRLHIKIDEGYDLSLLCRYMPALEKLDLATSYPHIKLRAQYSTPPGSSLDELSDRLIADSIRGLTPKVNPCLKHIRLHWHVDTGSHHSQVRGLPIDTSMHMRKTKALLKEMECANGRPVSLQTVVRLIYSDYSSWNAMTSEIEQACSRYPEIQVQQVGFPINLRRKEHFTIDQVNQFCAAYDKLCTIHENQSPSLHVQLWSASSSVERYVGEATLNSLYTYTAGQQQPQQLVLPPKPTSSSPISNFISFYDLTRDLLEPLFERCHVLQIDCSASQPYEHNRPVAPPVAFDPLVTFAFGDTVLSQQTQSESSAATVTCTPALQSTPSSSSSVVSDSSLPSSSSTIFSQCQHLHSVYLSARASPYFYADPSASMRALLTGVGNFADALQSYIRTKHTYLMHLRVFGVETLVFRQD